MLAGPAITAVLAAGPAWPASETPVPLLSKGGAAVDWWFAFKFNSQQTFAGCGVGSGPRACIFGGKVQATARFGQQFAVASSADNALKDGKGCVGATTNDPIGATFDQVYNGNFNYVIWNDQFYGDPGLSTCKSSSCGAPWGHSKGLLAWNDAGEGFVMQVSTPSWPGSGSSSIKRKAGNTLGCIASNNNLLASQHFFALKLNKSDLIKVLNALKSAGVVTDPTKLQIVKNGGPEDVQALVRELGKRPAKLKIDKAHPPREDQLFTKQELSSHVILITKTANLTAPPWQMVSAILNGTAERAATWWTTPRIYTTTKSSAVKCLGTALVGKQGPVAIALTGVWNRKPIKLAAPSNHAKIGISTSGSHHYVIFGDMNQQGALSPPDCGRSQNGRGGLFFVLDNKTLADSVADLIDGDTAPTQGKP
ncbi:MAG TPA: deoxyribonuclease II family protein [Bradyrhizobium sp.]|nr:deoxyribonuclease II family protein [Bradyrhizobium sp.]